VPCERFVYGVIDDLIYEVVKTTRTSGADVHARAFAHGFEALKNLDIAGVVSIFLLRHI
jgi:hypothetical protein